jgi:hypothetical protein
LVPVEIVKRGVSVETRRATGVDFQVQLESGTTLHVPAGFDVWTGRLLPSCTGTLYVIAHCRDIQRASAASISENLPIRQYPLHALKVTFVSIFY